MFYKINHLDQRFGQTKQNTLNENVNKNKTMLIMRLIIFFLFPPSANAAVSSAFSLLDPFQILLMAVWWQIIRKILIKYQTNQTSICLNPLVFGKSLLLFIAPNNVTSTSNVVTEVRFRFVKSLTSYCKVNIAHNQSTKLGIIIWIIPFIDLRFNFNVIFKPLFDKQFWVQDRLWMYV